VQWRLTSRSLERIRRRWLFAAASSRKRTAKARIQAFVPSSFAKKLIQDGLIDANGCPGPEQNPNGAHQRGYSKDGDANVRERFGPSSDEAPDGLAARRGEPSIASPLAAASDHYRPVLQCSYFRRLESLAPVVIPAAGRLKQSVQRNDGSRRELNGQRIGQTT
jgi:hypothetical protein